MAKIKKEAPQLVKDAKAEAIEFKHYEGLQEFVIVKPIRGGYKNGTKVSLNYRRAQLWKKKGII